MTLRHTHYFLWFLFALFSCTRHSRYPDLIRRAGDLLEEYPDSALRLLDSIPSPFLLNAQDASYYHLLRVQAKDKTGQSLSEDTILFHLRAYYEDRDLPKASLVYLYLGKMHYQWGDYETALLNYLHAEKRSDKLGAKQKALIQHNIGNLFFVQRDFRDAKMRYQRALEGFAEATDLRNQIAAYNVLGSCYMLEENPDSAYFYYDRCIELLDSLSHDHLYITAILSNLSVGYRHTGDREKAKFYLQKVFDYPINKQERARINYSLARLEEENDMAFRYYMRQALELVEEEEDLYFKATLYQTLSEHEEGTADYFSALDHHKSYVTYMRDFFEDKYKNSLKDMQHTYYLGNLEHANLILTIRQQRLIILMLIVLLLFLFVFGWFYRQNRKAMNQIRDNINYLQRMSRFYNEKERSLRNIVLHNFNILRKVALLDQYVINSPTNDKLLKRFHEIVYNNQEGINWDILYETMNKLHNDLFTRLREEFPEVDESEFRICCLSIARFTNIEIGLLMNYSVNTINAKKAALRKKLGVKPMGNIEEFLISYFDEKESCTFEK